MVTWLCTCHVTESTDSTAVYFYLACLPSWQILPVDEFFDVNRNCYRRICLFICPNVIAINCTSAHMWFFYLESSTSRSATSSKSPAVPLGSGTGYQSSCTCGRETAYEEFSTVKQYTSHSAFCQGPCLSAAWLSKKVSNKVNLLTLILAPCLREKSSHEIHYGRSLKRSQ